MLFYVGKNLLKINLLNFTNLSYMSETNSSFLIHKANLFRYVVHYVSAASNLFFNLR